MRSSISQVDQRRELPCGFGRYGGHLIAHTKIQSEVWLELVVILNIAAINRLAKIARRVRSTDQSLKNRGLILQEAAQAAEGKKTIGAGSLRELIRLNPFDVRSKF